MKTLMGRIELAQYFKELGFKVGAEIGVAQGNFSELLCNTIPGLRLYCVDLWLTYKKNHRGGGDTTQQKAYELAKQRLSKFDTVLVRKMSMNAINDFDDESLDFVFIDGNHDFDFVMEDIIGWNRKVRKGGVVSGHDYYHFHRSGVIEAVDTFARIHKISVNLTGELPESMDDKKSSWWWRK